MNINPPTLDSIVKFALHVSVYALLLVLPLVQGRHTAQAEVLKIAMPEAFKPYTYQGDDGVWTGIDVEIGREMHARMGLDVVYDSLPWARQLAYAERGLSAGILTVYCEDRKDFLVLSNESFYDIRISLFARQDVLKGPAVSSLEDLPEGSVIGIVRGNFYAKELARYPNLKINYSHNTELLMEQLYRKRIDYVMEEYLPFMYYTKEKNYNAVFSEVMVYLEDRVCTAFSKTFFGDKTAQLAEKANEVIRQLKAEGFIDRVIMKYRN